MTLGLTTHLRNHFIPHEGNDFRPYGLRHRSLVLYGVLAVAAKLIVALVLSTLPLAKVLPTAVLSSKLVELTNQARVQNGLPKLTVNAKLATGADLKAGDMLANGYFAHTSPTNITPWYWFKQAGYAYSYAGENLAIDFTTSESLMNAWLASPSHRRNILNPNYKEVGIAVQSGEFKGSPTTIAVQFFGTPYVAPKTTKAVAKAPSTPTTPSKAVPKPQVLGQEEEPPPPEPEPPAAPSFLEPAADSVVAGPRPWVTGEAAPGAVVAVSGPSGELGRGTASSLGYFRIELADAKDGTLTVTATATDPRTGKTSVASAPRTFSVDGTPPQLVPEGTVVLPSTQYGRFDVFASVPADATETVLQLGGRTFHLTPNGKLAVGSVDVRNATDTQLTLVAHDGAGNRSEIVLADLSAFAPTAIVSDLGPDLFTRVKLVLLSRGVVLALLVFLSLSLLLHMLSEVRVRHHPTTVSTLLLIVFLSTLFFV